MSERTGPVRGRELHAALDLLDRQLLDRQGAACGNVDDVELSLAADGRLEVTALLTGPGVLAHRMGWTRFGQWRQKSGRHRIPIGLAYEIGPAIRVAVDATDLATDDLERWAREHVIEHLPGGRRAPE